ncbi:DUF4064 domain-containing protein [Staphylococcus sp. SQ8-PEA]|uniref:DUF4064 domain-containing protein n=1 Tax=Staphylococcus marylandisciuri TaxID=2981529 RepID=A0ABT2QNU1_9STAP|nr:DUF4064 domain-containing protein [Staphylococcus marylandisciuri]MCU5745653.1 DUF4064 domain-containing protein [Staphylococcus marylandisciuri]
MSDEQFTQLRRPVNRVGEKVLGWLNWIFLLLLTVMMMFIALVSFSSDTSIQKLEAALNNNDFAQQLFTSWDLNTTQFVVWLQNGIWAIIVYFIVCLLISFLALISMNIRILSGILFLIASVITLPLILLFVTLIIPILFFIVSIMMFVRRDKVEYAMSYGPGYNQPFYNDDRNYEQHDQPEPNYDNPRKQDRDIEANNNHYKEDLRRGGYAPSDYTTTTNEEPEVLSRQEKYNYKKKYKSEDFNTGIEQDKEPEVYDDEQRLSREEAIRQQEERRLREKEEAERRKQEEAEEAARVKQQRKEEKAQARQEKKERKQRLKEKRKHQPSAVNQRRMNYEERKKVTGNPSHHDEDSVEESTEHHKEK